MQAIVPATPRLRIPLKGVIPLEGGIEETAVNCSPGTLALVVRSTTNCPCTKAAIGTPVQVVEAFPTALGAGWSFVGAPRQCRCCGRSVYGFLDADLMPLRGDVRQGAAQEEAQAPG